MNHSDDPLLGDVVARFERDEQRANHNVIMLVLPIVAGATGLFLGVMRMIRHQSAGLPLALIGAAIFWIGLMMFRGGRITLESVELFDEGIRWNDDRYPVTLRWDEIEYIEVVRSKEADEVRSLFLCQGDDVGQLLTRGSLRDFDELIEHLGVLAKDREIAFRPA